MEHSAQAEISSAAIDYRYWLRKSELFTLFGDEEIDAVASYCGVYAYEAGSLVFECGAPGDALFVVIEGRVAVGEEGRDSPVIAELVPGDSFGELDFLAGRPRNASALAQGKSLLLRFPLLGRDFSDVIDSRPSISARILESCLVSLARRIRKANSLLKENSPWVKELRRQAHSDKLTGLYNKSFLEERLGECLADGKATVALLMLKPDNFKDINDRYGHEAGDATLGLLASTLAQSLGPGDEAARFQGNELAVILPGRSRDAARAEAERLAARLRAIDLGGLTGNSDLRLGVSFGAALFPDHATTVESLIEKVRGLPLLGRERGGDAILFPEDA